MELIAPVSVSRIEADVGRLDPKSPLRRSAPGSGLLWLMLSLLSSSSQSDPTKSGTLL